MCIFACTSMYILLVYHAVDHGVKGAAGVASQFGEGAAHTLGDAVQTLGDATMEALQEVQVREVEAEPARGKPVMREDSELVGSEIRKAHAKPSDVMVQFQAETGNDHASAATAGIAVG